MLNLLQGLKDEGKQLYQIKVLTFMPISNTRIHLLEKIEEIRFLLYASRPMMVAEPQSSTLEMVTCSYASHTDTLLQVAYLIQTITKLFCN